MRTRIEPLPANADLLGWSSADFRAATEARRRRLNELFAKSDDDITADDAAEARELSEELGRLERPQGFRTVDGDVVPMRFPGGPSGRRRDGAGSEVGRLRGIGEAFLRGLGNSAQIKAALDGTSGGTMVPPFFDPRIRDLPQRALFVRSLIPTQLATGDKFWYLRQTVATHAAAAVAAGAEKPKSTYTVERIEDTVSTIAHVTEAIDRALLSDFDQLVDFLNNQLRLGVLLEEEDQILNGTGVGANLLGILATPGIQTQALGADPVPDAFYKAMTKIRAQFMEPTGVVIHPNDWQAVRLLRTADGEYIFGDPFEGGEENMWGKRVVQSPLISEGTGLVGAFSFAEVYQREEARITFAETGLGDAAGQEMFTRNQVRWRAESRLGLAVYRPAAFCTVTGI